MLSTLEKPIAPFLTVWMDTGSPPRYWTQTYQLLYTLNPTRSLSRNAGLSVSYINYLTPLQITSAVNLKLHTNLSSNPDTPLVSTSIKPPNSTLAPAALKVSMQSPLFYCWGRPLWSGWNIHFRFISICLTTLTCRCQSSVLGKCRCVQPSIFCLIHAFPGFPYHDTLYVLEILTCRPDDTIVWLRQVPFCHPIRLYSDYYGIIKDFILVKITSGMHLNHRQLDKSQQSFQLLVNNAHKIRNY